MLLLQFAVTKEKAVYIDIYIYKNKYLLSNLDCMQWQMRFTARTLLSSVQNSSGLHLLLHNQLILVPLNIMFQIIHQYMEFQTNVELPFDMTLEFFALRFVALHS